MRRSVALLLPLALAACGATPPATTTPSGQQPATSQPSVSEIATPPSVPPRVYVKMTAEGFDPKEVTVGQGGAVVFVNSDTKPHQPASDPHPGHTDYPGFDATVPLNAGSTFTFTFTRVGVWKYHDEMDPQVTGTIIVSEAAPPPSEAPASEAPILEAPASEVPVSDAPVLDAPVSEVPVLDVPVSAP